MKLYTIKNEMTAHFNPPFVSNNDAEAVNLVRNAILGGRDISLVVELENLTLCDLGEFDSIDDKLLAYEHRKNIVALADIPLPEYITKRLEFSKAMRSITEESFEKHDSVAVMCRKKRIEVENLLRQ